MNYFIKKYLLLCILLLIITISCKSKKHLTGNPYLDSKMSVSQRKSMEDKEILARENKAYLAQLEKNKKSIKENNEKFFDKKKQYKNITKNRRRIKRKATKGEF